MKKLVLFVVLTSMFCSVQALNPSREYKVNPGTYGLEYEEVKFSTEDGLNLCGWLYKARGTSYKMIILSDDGDGNMADLIEIASNFVSLGYNVLTYDYRGYGKSDDFEINNDFYIYAQFEKDVNAALDYVNKYHSKMKTTSLWGKGIGAGLSLAIATTRKEVHQVIADSPYTALNDVQSKIKSVHNKDVLIPLGYDKYMLEPKFALEEKGKIIAGMLFIAGETEKVYDSKSIKALGKLNKSRSTVFIVKGADASTTFSTDKDAYFEEVKKFLD